MQICNQQHHAWNAWKRPFNFNIMFPRAGGHRGMQLRSFRTRTKPNASLIISFHSHLCKRSCPLRTICVAQYTWWCWCCCCSQPQKACCNSIVHIRMAKTEACEGGHNPINIFSHSEARKDAEPSGKQNNRVDAATKKKCIINTE